MNTKSDKNPAKQILLTGICLFCLFGTAALFFIFTSFEYTNNAYLETETINIISKVKGNIVELNADNNQTVKKGEILVQIDNENYKKAVIDAQEKLDLAKNELKISQADIDKLSVYTKSGQNDLKNLKTNLETANSDYVRYKNAYKDGTVTKKDLDNAIKNLNIAQSQFDAAQNTLENANNEYKARVSKKEIQSEKINKLISQLQQARLNLSYTTITAPIDGRIVNKNIEAGQLTEENKPILSIVRNNGCIISTFDKSKTVKIKKAQKAIVKVNRHKKFTGKVEDVDLSKNIVKIKSDEDISNFNIGADAGIKVRIKIK